MYVFGLESLNGRVWQYTDNFYKSPLLICVLFPKFSEHNRWKCEAITDSKHYI